MIRIQMCALALAMITVMACGDDGDSDPDVDPTAEEFLELILQVDGEDSGLDSDILDGIDSSEFARVGLRTATISISALNYNNTPPLQLDDDGASASFRVRIPADAAAGAAIDVYYAAATSIGTPCGLTLNASASMFTAGTVSPVSQQVAIEGGNNVTTPVTTGEVLEIKASISEENAGDLSPGNWLIITLSRNGTDLADTCTGSLNFVGVAVEYMTE